MVDKPTRYTDTSANILDLLLVSHPAAVHNVTVERPISDHCLVQCIYSFSPMKPDQPGRTIYMYNKGNYNKLRDMLTKFKFKFLTNPTMYTVEENWQYFKSHILKYAKICIPSKQVNSRQCYKKPPWMNLKIKQLIRKRNKLAKKALKTQTDNDKLNFRNTRNKINQLKKESYTNYVSNLIGNIKTNTKAFYRFIKAKKTDNNVMPPLISHAGLATSDQDKAKCLNDYFASVFTTEDMENFPNVNAAQHSIDDLEVTENGVFKLLAGLDSNKSVGPDNISPRVLKEASSEIAPILTFIFNQSIQCHTLPKDWLTANVFPLHKKGPKNLSENYRPISLTCICCKVLEHIVYSHISNYLSLNGILTPNQHGFRPGFSCETQLILAVDDWSSALDRGNRCDVAVFDFSKAFDSVPHKRLLSKLKSYGIAGPVLNWVEAFLSNRLQCVTINGSRSPMLQVTSGVPQGSVLGPLLFLLYINDVTNSIVSNIRLFADDCIIYREIKTSVDKQTLQDDINSFNLWANKWQMKLNVNKCQLLTITKKKQSNITNEYLLNGTKIKIVESCTYLGVVVSKDLKWNLHVNHCVRKATNTLNLIRRNLYCCNTEVKKLAYTSLVRPLLEYASSSWDVYSKSNINSIESVQRRAARFIKSDYSYLTSVSGLIAQLGLETLADRRKVNRLCVLHKALNGLSPIPVDHLEKVGRSTRSSAGLSFIQLQSRIDARKFSFFPRTVVEWNSLPQHLKELRCIDSFKLAVSAHINIA